MVKRKTQAKRMVRKLKQSETKWRAGCTLPFGNSISGCVKC